MKPTSAQDIRDAIARFFAFIRVDIWRIRLADLPFGKSFLIKQLRIIILAFRGYDEDRCMLRASSLTFYTLLSIVPVAAMFFGVAKGFGFEKRLQAELFHRFPGQDEVLNQIISFSDSLLKQTQGGVIAGIGLLVLFWSVLKVLGHIEMALNDIWGIKESRSWGRKFSDYLSIMLISPILVIMSGSVTVFITTQVKHITRRVTLLGVFSPAKYNAIYGSFAALPLFLMWLQISWWIVLFGAELSFANQNVDTYEYEPDCLKVSPGFKKLVTLQVAHLLIKKFENGDRPLTDSQISAQLEMPIRLVHNVLYDLVESGLMSEIKTQADKEFAYQPARDINNLTIQYVLKALDQKGTDNIPVARTEDFKALSAALKKFREAMESSPANKLLKNI
ncbi:MAG: YihY/virulence factor BrkB family protein [Deltaproteobacteria bacterium]